MIVLLTLTAGAALVVYQWNKRNQLSAVNATEIVSDEAPIVVETSLAAEKSDQTNEKVSETIVAAEEPVASDKSLDNLESIWGIGPIYAQRLRSAGIHTFAQLAESSADHVQAIIAPTSNSPRPNVMTWLTQAAKLVEADAS